MRISRVYIETELVVGEEITLDRPQIHYLEHVLRLKSGAALLLFNGQDAVDYEAALVIEGKQHRAIINAAIPLTTESNLDCEIIQGLARGDHIDWMIQKTTELGVNRISMFNAQRTQSPMKPVHLQKKLGHWHRVAISACEQSGRAVVPTLEFYVDLEQAVAASNGATKLLLDFDGDPLASIAQPPGSSISMLLGPEGGLYPAEIEIARAAGFVPARLGPRVLRTETAATAALAIIQSNFGDLS
ncbi:MAG: 16S rRNA (uracil(1498)-N(3))-methyltransferase [Gammaproteobacteria bacterium]|nr:16S rRNA (uracil(1498)-N(3))-methyltransferase [Gammaproteobacteria bacterium]MDH3856412.1 16S rRNA (uracil(1498)-N(3))-methyltransferase [Gammaproteobacteria bacterium]